MLYQPGAPGDWGQMLETDTIKTATEMLTTTDGCNLFLRSWITYSPDIPLILHGLGAQSGWFIDMGNALATRGMNVYAMDHRGFGRSGGKPGHIDNYRTYIEDITCIVTEIRKRHPEAAIHILGHSMGGIFAAHFAAKYPNTLASILFLNPWIQDTSQTPILTTLRILVGGIFKSHRYWHVTGGPEVMTTNPEAVQMLNDDIYWCRKQTSSFLFQIFIVSEASHRLYETVASKDKTWKTFPGYAHDSEFEADRSLLDNEIVTWITEHAIQISSSKVTQK